MHKQGKGGLDDIYVVGCGPSLKGFDWSLLDDVTTIAVNGAVRNVPRPDYFITADTRFVRMVTRAHFWKTKAFKILVMKEDHRFWHKVRDLEKHFDIRVAPSRFNGEIGFSWADFCTGQNSGFCGLQLAVLLGAKRIHLLGIDCDGGHYHHWYPAPHKKILLEFLLYFRQAVIILKKAEIQVLSHSPISRLNEFVTYCPMERTREHGPQIAGGGDSCHCGHTV